MSNGNVDFKSRSILEQIENGGIYEQSVCSSRFCYFKITVYYVCEQFGECDGPAKPKDTPSWKVTAHRALALSI